jgi:hypothetical protein
MFSVIIDGSFVISVVTVVLCSGGGGGYFYCYCYYL